MAINGKGVYRLLASTDERREEDLFGKLPDEIIVLVLSRLERIEDRAITSAVARRWRYLWKHAANTILAFDSGDPFVGSSTERVKEFIRRFDQVVDSLSSSSGDDDNNNNTVIEGFNLTFNMIEDADNINYNRDIDRWLSFALHKKVKRLNLVFSMRSDRSNGYYSLIHSPAVDLMGGSLTSLVLRGVQVTGKLLEYILSTAAPLLEQLTVSWHGPSLVSFTVTGPSLKLKHLNVTGCWKLKRLYIHDVVNLESLDYCGNAKILTVKDTPRLVKAVTSVSIRNNDDVPRLLTRLPLHLEKLKLTLGICQGLHLTTTTSTSQFPKLRNLRQLELVLLLGPHHNVSCCRLSALLLDASPILHQLKIGFQFFAEDEDEEAFPKEEVDPLGHPHKSLKVLEIVGFVGCHLELGVADYLIQNTASLEQITVHTHQAYTSYAPSREKYRAAQELAKTHLGTTLASSSSSGRARLLVK